MKVQVRNHKWALVALLASTALTVCGPVAAQVQTSTTPVASFTAVPYTDTSKPFNYRLGESEMTAYNYTEMEFFVSGTANVYKKDANGNATVNTANNPYTSRILVRLPADPAHFSGNVVMEIYNGTPGYDADVEWSQTRDYLLRNGDAWVGITNGTGPANVLKNDYGAYKTCGSSAVPPAPAPCTGANNRYTPISFTSAGYTWDIISQTGALIKSNNGYPGLTASNLLPGYTVKHLFAMAESGAAQSLVLYINDIHSLWRMPGGGPIFDGFMPDERFGSGSSLAPGVAAWPTCSPRLVLNSDVPIMNLETQPDLVSSTAWCVRRADSDTPGNQFRSWELAGSPHLTPLVTDDDNSHRDLDGTPFVYSTFTCTHQAQQSPFPKEYFKQASLGNLEAWVINGTAPPHAPPITLQNFPTPPATSPAPSYVLDAFGNETGGLRTPFVDYPDRKWVVNDTTVTSTGPLGALFCTLYGYYVPLTTTQLQSEFTSHADYVKKVTNETNSLVTGRFLQNWNAITTKANAAASPVPTGAIH